MSEVTAHAPGTFCWIELGTTDQDAARSFYTSLFDWSYTDDPLPPEAGGGVYTMFNIEGQDVAALYTLSAQQTEQGVPPHWFLYIASDDVDAVAERVPSLGGTVMMPPFNVMTAGRMTVVQDPTGAVFGVWQARDHIGIHRTHEPGTLGWPELATKDKAAAGTFYTSLWGWNSRVDQSEPMEYIVFSNNGTDTAGMMQMTEEWGDVPSHWTPYFTVADCDAIAEKATSMGATLRLEPTDLPDIGRFAYIQDPQGAVFAIIAWVPQN